MIVVDASLATKWVLHEVGSSEALELFWSRRSQFAGPDLLFVEVASAVVRRGNERHISQADAIQTMDRWSSIWSGRGIARYETTPPRLVAAARLALELGHPLKDCIYLALAVELDCELATCDAKFFPKARTAHSKVRLLADYVASTQ